MLDRQFTGEDEADSLSFGVGVRLCLRFRYNLGLRVQAPPPGCGASRLCNVELHAYFPSRQGALTAVGDRPVLEKYLARAC